MAELEIERKYIIPIPDVSEISKMDEYTVSEISQTYLESQAGVAHRVRRRVFAGHTEYTETKKMRVDKITAVEDERAINEEEYMLLLKNIRQGSRTLTKTRHTFLYKGKVFEIDVYPEWEKSGILETELVSKDECVIFPPFIRIIREVSGERAYSNSSMSSSFPKEEE